jgi:hypothetical protein
LMPSTTRAKQLWAKNSCLGNSFFLYKTYLKINDWKLYDDVSYWLYAYDAYEMNAKDYLFLVKF